MNLRLRPFRLSMAVAVLFVGSCRPAGLQRQDQFEWAIEGAGSTSPPIVRVRLTDGQNSTGSIRCMFSDSLIDTIMREMGLPMTDEGYRQAVSFALASRGHSFRFVRPASWEVITATRGIMDAGLSKGCELIRQGKSALWADMQARVVEGPHFPLEGGTR
jgi:hypothetical protein